MTDSPTSGAVAWRTPNDWKGVTSTNGYVYTDDAQVAALWRHDSRRVEVLYAEPQGAQPVEVWAQTCECGQMFAGPLNLPCPACKQIRGGLTHGDPYTALSTAADEVKP